MYTGVYISYIILTFSPELHASHAIRVRQGSGLSAASFRPRLAAAALADQLVVPLTGSTEDFHLQVSVPARAHAKKHTNGLRRRHQTAGAVRPNNSTIVFFRCCHPTLYILPQHLSRVNIISYDFVIILYNTKNSLIADFGVRIERTERRLGV